MGLGDKIHNAAEKLHGKGKAAAGDATGDDQLKAEGKHEQVKAELKQAGEKIKDVFKKH
ncbi:CsbD family protein [Arthrobacter sp. PAMC25564]|uniref:CsbD family protein n=1 Tax=Arthrobacter sp. PAMC25564 TaxID=2565366 RepID=UPI0010A286F3|nr:CsbD family protein [Arthrobacter sp. PAMC25564]QCB97402.1 CsbD family protein [Arthrobacter sp. PAMC25564]